MNVDHEFTADDDGLLVIAGKGMDEPIMLHLDGVRDWCREGE